MGHTRGKVAQKAIAERSVDRSAVAFDDLNHGKHAL